MESAEVPGAPDTAAAAAAAATAGSAVTHRRHSGGHRHARRHEPASPKVKRQRAKGSYKRSFVNGILFLAGFSAILCTLNMFDNAVDPAQILTRILSVLAVLLVCHVAVLRHLSSPYYVAHIIVNMMICYVAYPDLIFMATDTVSALRVLKVDSWAMDLCNGLHLYHVVAFTDLRPIDFLHHIIMVFFCMPLFYVADYGPLANYNMFFVSGLPGGIDYVMLMLVRLKKLKKLEEKKWNTSLNIWIRGPFLLGSVFFSHVQIMLMWDELTRTKLICHLICQALQFWNAMYFTESVVGDYYRLSQKGASTIALYHDLRYTFYPHVKFVDPV